jgi:hypothetical protein
MERVTVQRDAVVFDSGDKMKLRTLIKKAKNEEMLTDELVEFGDKLLGLLQ